MDYSFNRYVDFREAIDYEKLRSAQTSKKSYDLLNDIRKFIELARALPNSIFLDGDPRYIKDKNGQNRNARPDAFIENLEKTIKYIDSQTERGEPFQVNRNLVNVHPEGHRIYDGEGGDIIGFLQNIIPNEERAGREYINTSKKYMEIIDGLLGRHKGANGIIQALERNIAAVEAKNPGFDRRLGMERHRDIEKAKAAEAEKEGKSYKIQRYTPGREEELYPRPKPPEPKKGFFSRLFGR